MGDVGWNLWEELNVVRAGGAGLHGRTASARTNAPYAALAAYTQTPKPAPGPRLTDPALALYHPSADTNGCSPRA